MIPSYTYSLIKVGIQLKGWKLHKSESLISATLTVELLFFLPQSQTEVMILPMTFRPSVQVCCSSPCTAADLHRAENADTRLCCCIYHPLIMALEVFVVLYHVII